MAHLALAEVSYVETPQLSSNCLTRENDRWEKSQLSNVRSVRLRTEIGVGAGDVPEGQEHENADSRCPVTPGQWTESRYSALKKGTDTLLT